MYSEHVAVYSTWCTVCSVYSIHHTVYSVLYTLGSVVCKCLSFIPSHRRGSAYRPANYLGEQFS